MVSKPLAEIENVEFKKFQYLTMIVETLKNIGYKINDPKVEKIFELSVRHSVTLNHYRQFWLNW